MKNKITYNRALKILQYFLFRLNFESAPKQKANTINVRTPDGRNLEPCKASVTETQIHIFIFLRSQVLPVYSEQDAEV